MTRKPAAEPLYPRAVRLSQADQLRLERLASAMGCSGSEAIRRAIEESLHRRTDWSCPVCCCGAVELEP